MMADETTPVQMPDLQDPLPESSWFWRRVFTFVVTGAILWMLWGAITRLGAAAMVTPSAGIEALLTLCKWMIVFNILMVTYYMVAPSAEQIVKMLKTASLLTRGVQFAGRRVVETPRHKSDTAQTVGLPPISPIPDAGEAIQPPGSYDTPNQGDDASWPPKE